MQSPRVKSSGLPTVAALALAASAQACGGVTSHAIGSAPPDGGMPRSSASLADAATLAPGVGPGSGGATSAALCPETPPTQQAGGTIITFQTDPYLGGQAMIYGEPNALAGGGTLTPLDLRYFLSNVALVRSDGSLVPVDLVTSSGMLEPYGVHLFNAEDASSTAWSIRAPAGDYSGFNLMLGISDACNAGSPTRAAPLSAESQLTWPPPFGYLFLRFEGNIDGLGADGGVPNGTDGGAMATVSAIAMGGLIGTLFAPVVHVDALLTVPASGPFMRHLRLDMDQVFKGATANVDVSGAPPAAPAGLSGAPTGDETLAGERLRQTAPRLPIFVLDP
jgi:hypothetical protein